MCIRDRGQLEPSKSLREFALFVAFFPQLIAGPILRAKQFLPQLREKIENFSQMTADLNFNRLRQTKPRKILLQSPKLKIGNTMMALGLFKKMFFDPKLVCNDPDDPWSANNALPDLLFGNSKLFHEKIK